MAKLTDLNIVEIFDNDRIQFRTPVSVTKEGLFTTTLPKETVDRLNEFGLEMMPNRIGNRGYFESKTLEGLNKDIHDFVKECVSRTLIEDKLVIKYLIQTKASYVVDKDGEILPNGYWVKDRKDFNHNGCDWHKGNKNLSGQNFTPSLSVYATVFKKKTYSYKSGKTVTTYERYIAPAGRSGSVDWLAGQVNLVSNDSWCAANVERDIAPLPEMDATEEVAAFFVKMVKFIDHANELFKQFNEPQNVLAYLAANAAKAIEF